MWWNTFYNDCYRSDCYWYQEWHDMNATIPQCAKADMGCCPCSGCKTYISNNDVKKLVEEYQEKNNA